MTGTEKDAVRNHFRELRRKLDPEKKERMSLEASRLILPLLSRAPLVLCYADKPQEMGTRELIRRLWEKGHDTALPRVEGQTMHFYLVRSFDDLRPGAMGIEEPGPDCRKVFCPHAPMIVPGLAFDRRGGRIGYGGGYYDRFFSEEPEHPALGLCFSFQMAEEPLPTEAHDRLMDAVITEQSVWICR